jgi:3-oxoadipate enol-lactonase
VRTFETESGVIAYQLMEPTEATSGDEAPPTITLLHNFMSSGRVAWGGVVPTLNRRFRVLLPDLPGHGRSIGHPPGYHHWAMARQLAALMRAEGAAEGHLAGCSSGGMIAQLLVHHKMVAPASLTLVSTTYSTSPATTGVGKALVPSNFRAGEQWLEATARLHDPYQGEGYFDSTLLPGFKALRPEDAIDLPLSALEAFQMPVCIIHGDRDEFFPLQIAEAMAEALPHATLNVVEQQTHALIFRRPWQVAERMERFFDRVAPSLAEA